jgi:DNA-binding NarL/FixJ family response regulator
MLIILADHHPQALWGLRTILQEKADLTIAGEASDANGLLLMVKSTAPDLVLMDWELPGRKNCDLFFQMRACKPKPVVVVMSSKSDFGAIALEAGADAFINKGDQPERFLDILQKCGLERNQRKEV